MVVAVALVTGPTTVRGSRAALLIIDVQDCFLSGGSLAVKDGDKVIPVINKMREKFEHRFAVVVISQDWHCPDHVSFTTQHKDTAPFDVINLTYNDKGKLCFGDSVPRSFPHAVDCEGNSNVTVLPQTLWPEHCVQNVTSGPTSAKISSRLTIRENDIVVKKGYSCGVDSYSAFFDNGGFRQTELDDLLKRNKIELVVVVGLALDYCVYYTSKDALDLGYKVLTVTDATMGVAAETTSAALEDMTKIGVQLILADDLEGALQERSQAVDPGMMSMCLAAILGILLLFYVIRI